jgi:hypothetical protein
MTTLTFTDPNRRDPEKIKQITKEMTQHFQAIDERLTLEHFDNFVDYGPEVFPHLAQLYWDPRVPNHPMEHFVYYEYVLRFNGISHYYITPYNEVISDSFITEKNCSWKRLKEIDYELLDIIHNYQIRNLEYWKDLYSKKEFQEEIEVFKKRTSHMIVKPSGRALLFVDPKKRDPESINKMTDWMMKELQAIDSHLTITHDDSFIDFGPEEGKFLAEFPYDPEEDDPDDDRRGLSEEEYCIFYMGTPIYSLTPYDYGPYYHGDFFKGGIPNIDYLKIKQEVINKIKKLIITFFINNFYYWRQLYSPADFQYETKKLKKDWELD